MIRTEYYTFIDSNAKGYRLNFKEIWSYRDLIVLLVKRDFISKYKQTILGPAWAIIQPLLTTIVFTFIFGNIAGLADCGTVPTFLFYMAGNITWQFFSGCLSLTSKTFIANSGTMGKVYFPRMCMPISTTLSQLIGFGIQFAMFLAFLLIYCFLPEYEIGINIYILLTPLIIIEMAMLGLGCGIIISSLTTKYRDLQFLVSFGVSLWMYATPVAYSLDIFRNSRILFLLMNINPMTSVIELFRFAFLGEQAGMFVWKFYILSWVITLSVFIIGMLVFNKVERTFMDTV